MGETFDGLKICIEIFSLKFYTEWFFNIRNLSKVYTSKYSIVQFIKILNHQIYINFFATGPAKIRHMGTNYIPPHNISSGIQYFHSVTCIAKPTKCLISAENFMAK